MEINLVPRDQPMLPEEIQQAYANGWFLAGTVLIAGTGQIAVPGQDIREQGWHNLWIRPQPLIPVADVIGALQATLLNEGDRRTLDMFCRGAFNLPLAQVVRANDDSDSVQEAMAGIAVGLRPVGD